MSAVSSGATAAVAAARSGSPLALAALFVGAFVVGTAELVVVGVLPLVAHGLAVSVSTAGTLVTSYALGIAIGGPVLTLATIRLPHRAVLRASFALYVLVNLGAALAGQFALLVVARAVTGALHGLFIGTALAMAAALVPPERMGRAIAFVLGGIATATAFGVPLGTLVGQSWGWRATFVAIVVLGALAWLGLLAAVPATAAGDAGVAKQARAAFTAPVVTVLLAAFLVMGAQFAALTYLTPFLEKITGLSGSAITLCLLVYGVASAIGTVVGGRAADGHANLTVVLAPVLVVLALGGMYLGRHSVVAVVAALVVWGAAGFGVVPSLQYRTVTLAGDGRDFAASLPASASTGGIAIGAVLGGWGLAVWGDAAPVLVAVIGCAVVLPLMYYTTRLRPPGATGIPGDVVAATTDPAAAAA